MPYKKPTTKKVIEYIKRKYGADPEYMWAKTPDNSIFRHADNKKWYAILMVIPKKTLGIPGTGNVEILNVKSDPTLIASLIDRKSYFPAYHMNKEYWITILMDGSVTDKNVFALIDISHKITAKNKK